MRITRKMYDVHTALDGKGWLTLAEVAQIVGEPRQNLDHSIKKLVESGTIERMDSVRPATFRVRDAIPADMVRALRDASKVFERAQG